jgi:hypothetical protein
VNTKRIFRKNGGLMRRRGTWGADPPPPRKIKIK